MIFYWFKISRYCKIEKIVGGIQKGRPGYEQVCALKMLIGQRTELHKPLSMNFINLRKYSTQSTLSGSGK